MTQSSFESRLNKKLAVLSAENQLRSLRALDATGVTATIGGRTLINFSSNDYLGLSQHPRLQAAASRAIEQWGVSSSSARLVSGTLSIHAQLETELAAVKGSEHALVFGAGYLANLGVLSALISRKDMVISDRYCHASLIDGIQLSRAEHQRFYHNDPNHLESLLKQLQPARRVEQQIFIVAESLYSMDGDFGRIAELYELAVKYDAQLVIDEAHAFGVLHEGRGLIPTVSEYPGIIQTATLSKAIGAYGGVCFSSEFVKQFLLNTSRPFIFNTALPPQLAAAALEGVFIIKENPRIGELLLAKAAFFRSQLSAIGCNVGASQSFIIPILLGDNETAVTFAAALVQKGLLVSAIRPPTVPAGSSRIRLSVTAAHTEDQLTQALAIIAMVGKETGVLS